MIAIIGGGASGLLAAIQIGLQATVPCRVALYDPAEYPSGGLAYGTRDLAHLLNVPAGRISALPDQPDHFLKWLRRPGNVAGLLRDERVSETDFVPRAIYGCYLFALLEETYSRPGCAARLDIRSTRVIDFIPARNGGTVVSADGDTEDVSHVVLALGNLPPRDPLPAHPFFRSPRYVAQVWQKGAISMDSPGDDVLLVGSGLTAVDVILSLERAGHRGKYFVTSRGGRWPQSHGAAGPYAGVSADRLPTGNIRRLVRFIREEIRSVGPEHWRGVIDALRPHTQNLWKALSIEERRRFLRHIRPFWESHRHRMPQSAWAELERLRKEGRLELFPGRLRDFEEDEEGVTARIQPKKAGGEIRSIRAGKVFNCIGPESNFRQHFNEPLLINLLARGVLHPDPLFLGLEANENLEPVGAKGHAFEQISLIGPPLKAMLWESTAIPEIRQQAALVASRALRHQHLQPSWEI